MDKSSVLHQFIELTQTPSAVAEAILERQSWNLDRALDDFYNGPTQSQQPAAPQATTSTSSQPKKKSDSKFKSFSQLVSEEANDEDDEKNYYAGGGRGSALNVENPDEPKNLVQDLLRKAEKNQGHPDRMEEEDEEETQKAKFTGTGYQLGDSTTPSRTIGDSTPLSNRPEKAHRQITFWKDGFQVGEGKLYRYDDPMNAKFLNELNQGRAPLELLDVKMGQDVDVAVMKKLDEEYVPPKRKLGGFHGAGQRLGSPVSPDYVPPAPQSIVEEQKQPETETSKTSEEPEPEGDTQVQIRLADGRRLVRRIMSTANVQELYDYVASETSDSRSWSLFHAFPVKPINDMSQSIKEAGLANAVAVQRWA